MLTAGALGRHIRALRHRGIGAYPAQGVEHELFCVFPAE